MLTLKEAALISTSVQAILYGFSVLMFILTIWLLLRNRGKRQPNYVMLSIACSLVTLATAEMIVNIVRVCHGFLSVGPKLPGGPEQYFADVSVGTFVAKSCLYNAQTLILDGVVIYRTYVVWNSLAVIVLPIIGWCGLLAAVIGTNFALATASTHASDVFAAETGHWITSNYSMTLATNLSATVLLAFKIWQINHEAAPYRSSNLLSFALRAVIESGAIYSMTITAALVTFVLKTNAVYVILDLISPIISIVFYMLIIRVRLASDRKSYETAPTLAIHGQHTTPSHNSALASNPYEMKAIAVEVSQCQETDADYSSLAYTDRNRDSTSIKQGRTI